jgi:hypothetical protein
LSHDVLYRLDNTAYVAHNLFASLFVYDIIATKTFVSDILINICHKNTCVSLALHNFFTLRYGK